MNVRCVRLANVFGNAQTSSDWLIIGRTYNVLSLVKDNYEHWYVRLMGEGENGVALFSLDLFEILDRKMPPTWVPVWHSGGAFELTPEPWSKSGFWEAFYDLDPEIRKVFELERDKIFGYANENQVK